MKTASALKNCILLALPVLSQIHTIFRGTKERVSWYLFIDGDNRLDYAIFKYTVTIEFLLLAYCLHYNKGIDRRVTRFILIITALDMVHLVTFAKQGFGVSKIGLAFLIYVSHQAFTKYRSGKD